MAHKLILYAKLPYHNNNAQGMCTGVFRVQKYL